MSADRIFLNRASKTVDESPAYEPISKVRVIVGENAQGQTTMYEAGTGSGRTIEVQNPWGTQAIADNMLAALQGYAYKPYQADGAILDPAAEIGDAVSIAEVYSVLADIETTFSPLMTANIGAREDGSIDHEYPYESPTERQINRSIAETRTSLTVEMGRIAAEVAVMNDPQKDGSIANRLTTVEQTVEGIHVYTENEIKTISGGVVDDWAELNFTPTKISSKVSSYFDAAGAADLAKNQAIAAAKQYTDGEIAPIEAEYTSAIEQSAQEIKATIAGQETKWDLSVLPEGVSISNYGYGMPDNDTARAHSGEYYLDQASGKYYYSTGYRWIEKGQFELITSTMQTQITTTSNSVTSMVTDVSELSNSVSTIDQRINNITLSVSSSNGSTTFMLTDGSVVLDTQTVDITVDSFNVVGGITATSVAAGSYIQSPLIYDMNQFGTLRFIAQSASGQMVYGSQYDTITTAAFGVSYDPVDGLSEIRVAGVPLAHGTTNIARLFLGEAGYTYFAYGTWDFSNATVILPS